MKTLKRKIITLVVTCSLIAALICGVISMIYSGRNANEYAKERLCNVAQSYGKDIDAKLSNIETSVNTLAALALQTIDDMDAFKSDAAYVDECTEKMKEIALQSANNTTGAMTYYIRYNPDFTEATSGLFASKESEDAKFKELTPTDFSTYDKTDMEHVGWYYIPVENGKPTWMDPYLNSNINVYMISYVVPLIVDGESVGIVGMDIDFNTIQEIANRAKSYDSGYAFLINEKNQVMSHPSIKYGTDLKTCSVELADFTAKNNTEGTVTYTYDNVKREAGAVALENGMKIIETVPESEIKQSEMKLLYMILIGLLLALAFAVLDGLVMGGHIAKPIKQLTTIISQTANLNFIKNPNSKKLTQMKDETGDMARAVHLMRKKLREMVTLIDHAGLNMNTNVTDLSSNMMLVSDICGTNSATTEELAAAMEEAASAMENVKQAITTVNENAKSIEELSQRGAKLSGEVKERAVELKATTAESTSQTDDIYREVRERSDVAMEQAKAVEKINELTADIMKISSKTNLLALNASIEAARAGEAGKGFAVVATEIGELASQTQNTVKDIDDIITQVNNAVSNMVECLDNSMNFLENKVLGDYRDFAQVGENYTDDAVRFENGMMKINAEINSLASAISDISFSVQEINTTVNESATGVSDIADKTSDMVEKISATESFVGESKDSAEHLNKIVSDFTIE